jgi:hypothetical protein
MPTRVATTRVRYRPRAAAPSDPPTALGSSGMTEHPVGDGRPLRRGDVPGWFPADDRMLFRRLLRWQDAVLPPGDLLELGAYLGRSAILIGDHVRPGETFTVCDLFGADPRSSDVHAEVSAHYGGLTRAEFERNYLAFHEQLPVVLQMPTSEVAGEVAAGSCRFVHVDASHLYEHVRADLLTARTVLRPEGLVVVDDYRAEHTPGVAAAVWEALLTTGLRPVVLSRQKFYGTWGDPAPAQQFVEETLRERPRWRLTEDVVAGHRVLVARRPLRRRRPAPPVAPSRSARLAARVRRVLRPADRAGAR